MTAAVFYLSLFRPFVSLDTVCKRAFPVSGATVWKDLPLRVACAVARGFQTTNRDSFCFPVPIQRHYHTITIHHYRLGTCDPCNI